MSVLNIHANLVFQNDSMFGFFSKNVSLGFIGVVSFNTKADINKNQVSFTEDCFTVANAGNGRSHAIVAAGPVKTGRV